MNYRHALAAPIISAVLLAFSTGCADMETGWSDITANVSVGPASLPAGHVSPRHVVLVLNNDLTNYEYTVQLMHNHLLFPLGTALRDYARNMASKSFKQADEAANSDAAFTNLSADIVLIPRPVKAAFSMGTKVQDPYKFTLVVEWLAEDRATKNTIWLKTVTTEVADEGGKAFSGMSKSANEKRRQLLIQNLFDNLSRQTYELMQNTHELGISQIPAKILQPSNPIFASRQRSDG